MRSGPSKKMEAATALLIPPACREEVLGDLYERYRSKPQYILDVAGTLPLVIWSQIRRTTEPQIFLLESLAVYLSFLGAQWLAVGPGEFLRLAIPSLAMLFGLRLTSVYSTRPWTPLLAVSFAFVASAGLPRWTMIFGGCLAALLLWVLRMWFPQRGSRLRETPAPAGSVMSLDDIRRKTLEFQVKISRRNLREYVAAAFVFLSMALSFQKGPLAAVLIIAGVLYVVWQLHSRGAARTAPPDGDFATYLDFHRRELERQRDLLRTIWSWYLGPMIPGLAVAVVSSAIKNPRPWIFVYAILVVLLFLGIGKLNLDAARKLQREIDALNAMEAHQ